MVFLEGIGWILAIALAGSLVVGLVALLIMSYDRWRKRA
jgi:hypothetical protein